MTAEVFTETAYVADCDECGYQSELLEARSDAEREAKHHNEHCPTSGDPEDDRDDRQRFQDALDEAMGEWA